jgi:hypothetical protein
METKLSRLKRLMAEGNYHAALRLANSFFELGKQKEAITRAWAAAVNPEMYIQMGDDPKELIHIGILAINERFGPV